jgi:DNA-binding beta-propeller fold protein YncE
VLTLILAAASASACGSLTVHELPPAAEPARSPRPAFAPTGRVARVGHGPEGVAISSRGIVAVALRDPPALALVDAGTGRVRRTIALPGAARHLAATADGGFVVPAETADRLIVVGPDGARRADVTVGAHPHDAAVAAGRIFVGDEHANTLSVFDGPPGARAHATVRVATQPGGVASVASGRAIAVVSVRERVLELYDARTLHRVARVGAGIGPTHVVGDASGAHLYVVDTAGGALLVYDLRPRLALVRRYALPGAPYGVALDRVRRRLWVTLTARNEIVELPAHGRPHALRRLATVRQPDSVAVDGVSGRLYITGRDAGVLQIVDP